MVEEMLNGVFEYAATKLSAETGVSLAFIPEPNRAYHDGRHILIVRDDGNGKMLGWLWDKQKQIFRGYVLKPNAIILNGIMERVNVKSYDTIELDFERDGYAMVGENPKHVALDLAISSILAGRPIRSN